MNRNANHEWHVALNKYNDVREGEFRHWMYEAKRGAEEQPRLAKLFRAQREGTLPKVHQQCSLSAPVEMKENNLTCSLGVRCRECPHLMALAEAKMEVADLDEAQAWTCVGHILQEIGSGKHVDTSEGMVMTDSDRMFWDNVYRSMSADDSHSLSEDKS